MKRGKAKAGKGRPAKQTEASTLQGGRSSKRSMKLAAVAIVVLIVFGVTFTMSGPSEIGSYGSWGNLCWLAGSPGIDTYEEVYNQRGEVHTNTYNKTMLWGSYRPQTYFGIRSREEKSFLFSFAWGDMRSHQIRYTTEDDSSIVFGWNRHDGTTFGSQQITDLKHRVELESSFIKYPNPTDGGSWVARIQGRQTDTSRPLLLAPVFSSQDGYLEAEKIDNGYRIKGQTKTGKFTVTVYGDYTAVSRNVKDEWNFHFSPTGKAKKANQIHLFTEVTGSFSIEVVFESEGDFGKNVAERGCTYSNSLAVRKDQFERRFLEKMGSSEEMPMYAMSNLIGGMGYWYGTGLIDDGRTMAAQELFSAVPSRSKFPRGFLWDEGFHQLVVARWDPHLSQDVILSWLSQMTESGWIPREQIRGDEPRSRVPGEFVAQNPKFANPPTLLIQIQNFALEQQTSPSEARTVFLNLVWPRLRKWYSWFRETQSGNVTNTFKWIGKKGYHLLTCGLDDYPRSKCNGEGEKHLDLLSWMILMSDTMHNIADVIGDSNSASELQRDGVALREALREHHFDDSRNIYADVSGCPPKKDVCFTFYCCDSSITSYIV